VRKLVLDCKNSALIQTHGTQLSGHCWKKNMSACVFIYLCRLKLQMNCGLHSFQFYTRHRNVYLTSSALIMRNLVLFFFWWPQLAAGLSLNCASYWGGWGERSCPRSVTAIHSVALDRTPNLPFGRRTLNHWTICISPKRLCWKNTFLRQRKSFETPWLFAMSLLSSCSSLRQWKSAKNVDHVCIS